MNRQDHSGWKPLQAWSTSETFGRTVPLLSLVSKDWRAVCVSHMFRASSFESSRSFARSPSHFAQDLGADDASDPVFFAERIKPRFARCVERVFFDGIQATLPMLSFLLSTLTSHEFPRLRFLRIDQSAVHMLFGRIPGSEYAEDDQALRWELFKVLANAIEVLFLDAMDEQDLEHLLPLFPRLRFLSTDDLRLSPRGGGIKVLTAISHLDEFEIFSSAPGELRILDGWQRRQWMFTSKMRRFRINMSHPGSILGHDAVTFVEQLGPSLRLLELQFGTVSQGVIDKLDRATYPHLAELYLFAQPTPALAILFLLRLAPVQSLAIACSSKPSAAARSLFDLAVEVYSATLRHFTYQLFPTSTDASPHLGLALSDHIRSTCASHSPPIALDHVGGLSDPFLHPRARHSETDSLASLEWKSAAAVEALQQGLNRVQQGLNRVKTLTAQGGNEKETKKQARELESVVMALLKALEPVRARRELELD